MAKLQLQHLQIEHKTSMSFFFTANLQLQLGIEQMLEQDSYSSDQQADLVPLLIICLCSH